MAEAFFFSKNPELDACFNALPKSVQKGIMQSGVEFNTPEELKQFARHLTGSGENA